MSVEFEDIEYPKSEKQNELDFGDNLYYHVNYIMDRYEVKFKEIKIMVDEKDGSMFIIKDGKRIV